MRKMWVYAFACTTAVALGALFFGVSSSAATDTDSSLSTALSAAATERPAPVVVAESDSVKPAALTAAAVKKTAPQPQAADSAAPGDAAGRRTAGSASGGGSELSRARAILAGYIARYPILRGTTVTIGNAQGHQAIAYYKEGRIVISANHSASLERIIAHEIWHIIDWRDNNVINWGENVPPR